MPESARRYLVLIREAWKCFRAGRYEQVAAVMALHLTMGLVALGIVLSWLAGITGVVSTGLSDYVHELIGENAGGVFDRLLGSADLRWRSWLPVAAAFAVLCGNVVAVMRLVQDAINTAAGVESSVERGQWTRVILKRISGTAFVALVSLALVGSFSAKTALEVLDYLGIDPVAASPWAFRIVEVIAALLLATVLFCGVFRLLPDAKLQFRQIWHGAFWAAKLYTLAQILAAFAIVYVGGMSFYGEAAVLLVLIAYLWCSAASFLWGAQVLRVELRRRGADPRPSAWAERLSPQAEDPRTRSQAA